MDGAGRHLVSRVARPARGLRAGQRRPRAALLPRLSALAVAACPGSLLAVVGPDPGPAPPARPPGDDATQAKLAGRLLRHAHGITGSAARGPVPSAGGLQALELYLISWTDGWLPPGAYYSDRVGHWLAQVVPSAQRAAWHELVPSLGLLEGGALLWVLVGDGRRVARKYAERGYRFLLLEAGHLMQNLCLLSESLGLCTIPLGGFLERAIACQLVLPDEDLVLYVGVCGVPVR